MSEKEKEIEAVEIRSEEVQEILGQMPKGILHWGNGTLLALVALLFVLSGLLNTPTFLRSKPF